MSSLAPSAISRSRRAAASLRTSARISRSAAARDPTHARARTICTARRPGFRRRPRGECPRGASGCFAAAIVNSSMRAVFGQLRRPRSSSHSSSSSSSRSATRKAAITWPSDAPSSSVRSNGMPGPSRLTRRLATLVREDFVAQPMGANRHRHGPCASACGNASNNCGSISLSSARRSSSAASCRASFDIDSTTASSGRVRPRFSWTRRSSSSLGSRPSTLRSSRPDASSSSIVRT